MEYCEGGKVDDREYMDKHNISVNEVSIVNFRVKEVMAGLCEVV